MNTNKDKIDWELCNNVESWRKENEKSEELTDWKRKLIDENGVPLKKSGARQPVND